jgi:hypothetical protein
LKKLYFKEIVINKDGQHSSTGAQQLKNEANKAIKI